MTGILETHTHQTTKKEKAKTQHIQKHTHTAHKGAHTNRHILRERHALFMRCVCVHTQTHTHRAISFSQALRVTGAA